VLEVRSVSHAYSGVLVLRRVDLQLAQGEIRGLVGQNGAGKSTLIRILTGAERLLDGQVDIDGHNATLESPADAQRVGIGVVHQDLQLFPHLSVAKNIFAVRASFPRKGPWRLIDWAQVDAEVDATLSSLGLHIPVWRRVGDLDLGEQKLVEIARTMMLKPRFLILDEPTASLEARASARILELLLRLRTEGVGVMLVSHRIEEIRRVADQITILRDGRVVADVPGSTSQRELVHMMLGEHMIAGVSPDRALMDVPSTAVSVSGVRAGGNEPVAFEVSRGEIFGLTGLVGSGAERVMRMLGGAQPLIGKLDVFGERAAIGSPADAASLGIGYIPEDRKREGLVPGMSVAANISLASLRQVSRSGFMRAGRVRDRAEHYRKTFSIKCRDINVPVRTLSGGNQQKVLIAKWLSAGVRILVVAEPTHGVDVGGKVQIHDLLRDFAAAGGTVILSSCEAEELVGICHRVAVFRLGRIVSLISVSSAAEATDSGLVGRLEDIIEATHEADATREALEIG